MELSNEYCAVKIQTDPTYTLQSTDHKQYDLVLNPDYYTENDYYKVFSIHVALSARKYIIALIGDYHSVDDSCVLLDAYIPTVMQNNTISQIDVRNANLLLHRQ